MADRINWETVNSEFLKIKTIFYFFLSINFKCKILTFLYFLLANIMFIFLRISGYVSIGLHVASPGNAL